MFKEAAEASVPTVLIQPQKPMMTTQIRTLIKQREALKRGYLRTGHRLIKNMYDNVKKYVEKLSNTRINYVFQKYVSKFVPNQNNNKKLENVQNIKRKVPEALFP